MPDGWEGGCEQSHPGVGLHVCDAKCNGLMHENRKFSFFSLINFENSDERVNV